MIREKNVKILKYGPILSLSSIQGPILTPIKLKIQKISELVDGGCSVVECILEANSRKIIREIPLTKENYRLDNNKIVSEEHIDIPKSSDEIITPPIKEAFNQNETRVGMTPKEESVEEVGTSTTEEADKEVDHASNSEEVVKEKGEKNSEQQGKGQDRKKSKNDKPAKKHNK